MTTLDDFDSYLEAKDRSPHTIRGYRADLRYFERWLQENHGLSLSPSCLTNELLLAYQQHLLVKEYKPSSINRKIAAVAIYAHWAAQTGQAARSSVLVLHNATRKPTPPRWLSMDERTTLQQSIKYQLAQAYFSYPRQWIVKLRDTAVVLLLMGSGLRVGELCALRLSNLELTGLQGPILKAGEVTSHKRVIPLRSKQLCELLSDWLTVRPRVSHDALFVNQRGCKLDIRSIQRAVEIISRQAGLQEISTQILRYTFIRAALDDGMAVEQIATWLGLSSPDTIRRYFLT